MTHFDYLHVIFLLSLSLFAFDYFISSTSYILLVYTRTAMMCSGTARTKANAAVGDVVCQSFLHLVDVFLFNVYQTI